MNLQSKFGYCIITQTLNIALCQQEGITDRWTNGRTDGQTGDPITRCPQRTERLKFQNFNICSNILLADADADADMDADARGITIALLLKMCFYVT